MPILLKTQAERTAKTPIPACRARVGGLCGFRSSAERVPNGSPKPDLCQRAWILRKRQAQKKVTRGRFSQREKPQAAKQDKTAGSCALRGGHICPRCGQFRGFTRAFQKAQKSAMGCCRMKKARRFKENSGVPAKNTR